jgi:hypothetical protein
MIQPAKESFGHQHHKAQSAATTHKPHHMMPVPEMNVLHVLPAIF